MKIRFLTNYAVQAAGGKSYNVDDVIEVSEDSANHFVARGVAEVVTAKPAAKKKASKKTSK